MREGTDFGTPSTDETKPRSKRGFASMTEEKRRSIASMGGRAAHEKGTAHEFTSAEARAAGCKGGATVSKDREHMSRIGAKGGRKQGQKSKE